MPAREGYLALETLEEMLPVERSGQLVTHRRHVHPPLTFPVDVVMEAELEHGRQAELDPVVV